MLYYKVKPRYDNLPRYKRNAAGYLIPAGIYVRCELYTPREIEKEIKKTILTRAGVEKIFEPVNVSKKSVYWFFGCRYEINSDVDRVTVTRTRKREKRCKHE